MRYNIKSFSFALLLAFASAAGAQTLPTFGIGSGPQNPPPLPQLPAVPPPTPIPGPSVPQAAAALPDFAFSGQADIEALIESAIRGSKSTVEAAVYGFTLPKVAQALVEAKGRGVKVRVLVNESHLFGSKVSEELQMLLDEGVEVRSLRGVGRNGIMHNKLGIYDGKLVSAGSFNWAVTANEANSENALFLRDAAVVAGYRRYFEWMWDYGKPHAEGPSQPIKKFGPPPEDPMRSVLFGGVLLPSYTFSPGGRTEENIKLALDYAMDSADVAVFSFFSESIAGAVINAHKRGLKVRVLVDRVQASQSEVGAMLMKAGIPFRWSQGFSGKGVMHNKFTVLDRKLLITGSFNWSINAQDNNFENTFYTAAPAYSRAYTAQFEKLFEAAETPTLDDLQRARAEYKRSLGF